MNATLTFFNPAVITQIILHLDLHIQGLTQIVHDGTYPDQVATISQWLSNTRPITVSTIKNRTTPEMPTRLYYQIPDNTIILGRTPGLIFDSLKKFRLWDARRRVVVVLDGNVGNAKQWLTEAWKIARIVNMVVVASEPIKYFTWFPYKKSSCGTVTEITELEVDHLFPRKISNNLNRCPLLAVASFIWPMTTSKKNGVETRLASTMAEMLNLDFQFVKEPKIKVWNHLNADGMPMSGFLYLWNNDVDITFSGVSLNLPSSLWADFLPSHMEDTQVWFLPAPPAQPIYAAVYRVFPASLWAYVAVSFFATFMCSALLHYLGMDGICSPIMRSILLSLNLPTALPPSTTFRIFAIAVYIYSLHITTAYQTALMIFLSNTPREAAIRTVEELAHSDLPMQYSIYQRPLIKALNDSNIALLTLPERSEWRTTLWISRVALGEIGLLGPKLIFSLFIEHNYDGLYRDQFGIPRVIYLKESVATSRSAMYMSRGHPLHPRFHRYMTYLLEGGFPAYFLQLEKPTPELMSRDRRPFGLKNVASVFYLHTVMMIASVILFLAEILFNFIANRFVRKRNLKRKPKIFHFRAA